MRLVGRHVQQTVGLAVVGRELRDELRRRDARRARDADLRCDLGADRPGDLRRPPNSRGRSADVEERLVERDRLHERCVSDSSTSRNRLECTRYASKSGGRKIASGHKPPRADRRHRRTHTRRAVPRTTRSMTTPREPVPPTIDRLPARGRILQHLDARVERVEVDVQDRLGSAWLMEAHATARPDHPAEPGLACHSRRAGACTAVGAVHRLAQPPVASSPVERREIPDILRDDAHPFSPGAPQLAPHRQRVRMEHGLRDLRLDRLEDASPRSARWRRRATRR